MEEKADIVEIITQKIQELCRIDSRILAVFLMGSAARNTMRPDSDIDLAIMFEPEEQIGALERAEIAGTLSYDFAQDVDLGEITSKNLIYAREALLTGIPIYMKDSDRVNLIRANLLGMYIQFNRDRKEVLDAYKT
ncbi:MAG: nucleotidyltransferase domain-containing protein [Spirochaetaceae bacterium]|nr:nucleotidyltransferase domain-containing protein [Spirochaetaceae bacterium]